MEIKKEMNVKEVHRLFSEIRTELQEIRAIMERGGRRKLAVNTRGDYD